MGKDPAFLFYSKDWLEGTAELMPDEKGVYVDLLCFQHQRGALPSETFRLARLVGIPHEDFLKIWKVLKPKFVTEGERTYNRKLNEVMSERSMNAYKNKIIGIFSGLLRKANLPLLQKEQIKKAFKIDDFLQVPKENINERINEWFNGRYSALGDENGNAVGDENGNVIKEPENRVATQKFAKHGVTDEILNAVFDSVTRETLLLSFRDVDVEEQWKYFCVKVRGAPELYGHRDVASLRLAFNAQLRSAPKKKQPSEKREVTLDELKAIRQTRSLQNGNQT